MANSGSSIGGIPPAVEAPDAPLVDGFRQSPSATILPQTQTENISRTGNTAFGNVQSATPIARVDIAAGNRTGTDRRVATTQPLYVTGTLPGVNSTAIPGVTPTGGAEFLHSNQTQGMAFGFDGIYTCGSNTNQDFTLKQQGSGTHRRIWGNVAQAISEERNQSNFAVNSGFRRDYYVQNAIVFREYFYDPTGDGVNYRQHVNFRHNGAERRAYLWKTSELVASSASLSISANTLNKDKLVMYNEAWSGQQFMGYGMESGAMTAQTYSNWDFRWYNAPTATTATLLMELSSTGNLGIGVASADLQQARLDVRPNAVIGPVTVAGNRPNAITGSPLTVFCGTVASGVIDAGKVVQRWVREQVGGISWGQTVEFRLGKWANDVNARTSLEIWLGNTSTWTANTKVMHMRSDGRINTPLLPVFANNAAAVTGGLDVGDWYRTPGGVLQIRI